MDTNINPTPASTDPSKRILPVEETLKTAWSYVYGFKGTFWLAMLIIFLISIMVATAEALASPPANAASVSFDHFRHNISLLALFISLIGNILNVLFSDGLFYIGLRRVANLPIKTRMIFTVFRSPLIFKLIILMLFKLLIMIVFVLMILLFSSIVPTTGHLNILQIAAYITFIILMLYVFIRMSLAELLILDKGVNPITSLQISYQATSGFSLTIFWLIILQVLIILISAIPLGIGLIWSFPFVYLVLPVIYNRLIGISTKE